MSDRLYPMTLDRMVRWIHDELQAQRSVFGVGQNLFYRPAEKASYRTSVFGQRLDTPVGVAAGPHTQMSQNIVTAWLCGARFIELKTVQTLDELSVSKPCIDMEDAGYNVEWSQELRVDESIHEYINAWVLIHALHRVLGFEGAGPGTIFNISVGYNMDGLLKPNVQRFLNTMRDAGDAIARAKETISAIWPDLRGLDIPQRLSDNVTLSTMHGCPPGEIGTICRYMLEQQGLHTYVKLNPTLLGPKQLRSILNDQLGFDDITVPDAAFGHDIKFDDAVALIRELRSVAASRGLAFGVKLSNTLEVINHRKVFTPNEKQMYMSGRPLHALTVNVADRLQEAFDGELDISFAGGADCFNIPSLMTCGVKTVTVCSDLLRSGGYTRLHQYFRELDHAMEATRAENLDSFVVAAAGDQRLGVRDAARRNLRAYAAEVLTDARYRKETYDRDDSKSSRPLGPFDCIKAPCTEICPVEQQVPAYMRSVKEGNLDAAARIVKNDNTMPAILGRACHHPCHTRCVRTHIDQPVEIREIKRFIMDHADAAIGATAKREERIAIIGAGPCGLATADFLSRAGYPVTIFDARDREGGMVASSIPGYRASDDALKRDTAFLEQRGVTVEYGKKAGRDFQLDDLKKVGFAAIVIAIGAQNAGFLGLEREDVSGVWDSLSFLRASREGNPPAVGRRVGVVGGGDVAMDCARTAWRLGADDVQVIYRRTRREMPAQPDELKELLDERIPVRELLAPRHIMNEGGKLTGLMCSVMELGEPDASGRRRPRPVNGETMTLPLDTLVIAINQSADFSWLKKNALSMTKAGYIDVDPLTLQTSIPGVYAGGDAIGDGPATIVKALGDGKRIARAIRTKFEGAAALKGVRATPPPHLDRFALQSRRALRVAPVARPEREPTARRDFNEVVGTMDASAAKREAARCLDCDALCSYCVGVCPNLALFTYDHDPVGVDLPVGRVRDGQWFTAGGERVRIGQRFQVGVYADFCNECGNCVTFCPSAGKPYREKPRIYDRMDEFTREDNNAYLPVKGVNEHSILARYDGHTHILVMDGTLRYRSPELRAEWSLDWNLLSLEVRKDVPDRDVVSLKPAVEMASILKGLVRSMPFYPMLSRKELDVEVLHETI